MLLFNDLLSGSQVKGRRFGCAPRAAFDKEVFAVLTAEFLPGDRFGLTQNGSDPLAGNKTTLGKSLGVTAVTIILRVSAQPGSDRVKLDVSSHGGQGLSAFQ